MKPGETNQLYHEKPGPKEKKIMPKSAEHGIYHANKC